MASVRKKGLYEEDDRVEEFLMNQAAKFIRYEKLGLFAKDIKIKERELEIIMAPNYLNPHDRIAKVLDSWYQSLPRWYKVKDFMMDVNQWFGEGYVDRDIWNHLQKYVKADVLPVSTSGAGLEIESLKRQLAEKEREMERQKKKMEQKLSKMKITKNKSKRKPSEERKSALYQKEKEINNFIPALDHMPKMNNQRPSQTEERSDESGDEIEAIAEKDEDKIAELSKKPALGETYVKPKPSRMKSPVISVPEVTEDNVRQNIPGQVKTQGTSSRLMDRITVLRRDCIGALGVQKLKEAYDILDNEDGEELEAKLVTHLGKYDFDLYAGKIWQLKFCEEAAFGLI